MSEQKYRIEHDSLGEMKVPADKYWAAQMGCPDAAFSREF